MAFTGYNFESLEEIQPYLEPKGSGISALWARTTALKKQHLYYTDETWCKEGTGGFFQGEVDGIGQTAMGICMDIK
ncbi:hypothetical protein MCOR34_011498 [Pyricularia oryzae]|nr:hypothetical protein MCOR34_011498 [Pyricularia oryzae]